MKEMKVMENKQEKGRNERTRKTLQNLLQLDEMGLLIIDRDVRILLARQKMDENEKRKDL